uniref:hypothetical protein n=1 Tax=Laurencia catarinensis TaxID=197326 RepID=UPI0028D03CD5|nr:hypothetical protein RU987_pgp143 [Laurencia catarinensis]WMP12437.1 hypothetical protein [Laurencia catarinensis]
MDKSYLIIRIDEQQNIELHYFFISSMKIKYNYPTCITVHFDKLKSCFSLVSLCYCFNMLSTSHKLYIGAEVFKAYLSVKFSQHYIQE